MYQEERRGRTRSPPSQTGAARIPDRKIESIASETGQGPHGLPGNPKIELEGSLARAAYPAGRSTAKGSTGADPAVTTNDKMWTPRKEPPKKIKATKIRR